jgi:transglutaminase-like putative cysteine protease
MAINEPAAIMINDQMINAGFFGEARWLTQYITPNALEVQRLHSEITAEIPSQDERIIACWKWVASRVRYVTFVNGRLWIAGKSSTQKDLWTLPEMTIRTKVGNCAVKSFLLTSLLRRELPANQVYCVLGNLYNGKAGGHAWLNLRINGTDYTMESTTDQVPALVPSIKTTRYEPVHYFNDVEVLAVPGRTQLVPFTDVYSTWLTDYLHWASIEKDARGA